MNKKMSAYLKEENLLTLLSQNNFIVPEIQREYVWGGNEKVIVKFLNDLKDKIGICCSNCNLPSSENKINIGFLYSYKPDYVKIEHDRFLDENLIDGQQRFTTLFLLLFYCALKETKPDSKNRKDEFLILIRFEEKLSMCFDFKVRDLTKRFLLELVEKVDSIEQLKNIVRQTWFLKDYQNDVSIKSMLKALGFIQSVFSDNTRYYNHLINYVVFWHFKTEATSQGEELYITMNARGEELADNEVTKAALMIGGSEIYEWGKKWEDWQQFFWKNRDKADLNPSADKGFNGFLGCIAGLESYLKYEEWENAEKDISKLLTLEKVEKYFIALQYLITDLKAFAEKRYVYHDWVDKCLNIIFEIFNKNETEWFENYRDENKGTAISKMVFIWSILHYLNTRERHRGNLEALRVLRLYYIRYNNFNRAIGGLKKNIEQLNQYGPFKAPCGPEENLKHILLSEKVAHESITEIEELIWEIEDHPLNIDGSDVADINISHIVDFKKLIDINYLKVIRDNFNLLFPNGTKKGSNILKTILLHFGDFWKDTSYYHKRYDFSDWKRNIRKPEFKSLINSLIGKTPEVLLTELQNTFLAEHLTDVQTSLIALSDGYSLRQKLIFYSLLISPEDFWSEGERLIICDEIEHSRLFKDESQKMYNSKGTVRSIMDLWEKAVVSNEIPLSEIKNMVII
jgi:uncharacterized protein with ParB-like and HNH nuclease domain